MKVSINIIEYRLYIVNFWPLKVHTHLMSCDAGTRPVAPGSDDQSAAAVFVDTDLWVCLSYYFRCCARWSSAQNISTCIFATSMQLVIDTIEKYRTH